MSDCQATLEGELVSEVHINTAEIPASVRDDLAAATLDFIHDLLRQPGGREMIEAKKRPRPRDERRAT